MQGKLNMRSKKLIGAFSLSAAAAAMLVACGGGGGSSGDTAEIYSISVTASPAALPTNYAHLVYTGMSERHPYLSIIRVQVHEGGRLAQTSSVGCEVNGLRLGGLVYLDDAGEEISDTDGNVTGYTGAELHQTITGETNSGAISFGFLASDGSGAARVTCSVTDPRDHKVYRDYADIQVGYATGVPAVVNLVTTGARGDSLSYSNGLPLAPSNTLIIQAEVLDAALQRVPNPSAPNVLAEIASATGGAGSGARIGNVLGGQVQATTMNGVAQFPLTAGSGVGTLCVRVTADRNDNNVANGVADPVSSTYCLEVSNAGSLTVTAPPAGTTFSQAQGGTTVVQAAGGMEPYSYQLLQGGELGITIGSDGTLTVPAGLPVGDHTIRVLVTDANGNTLTSEFVITISAVDTGLRLTVPDAFATVDANGIPRLTFAYTQGGVIQLGAEGGTPGGYTYSLAGANTTLLTVGTNGVIEVPAGTCPCDGSTDTCGNTTYDGVTPGTYRLLVRVTDSTGQTSDALLYFTITNNCVSSVSGFSPY